MNCFLSLTSWMGTRLMRMRDGIGLTGVGHQPTLFTSCASRVAASLVQPSMSRPPDLTKSRTFVLTFTLVV